jgi:acyl carrier protein
MLEENAREFTFTDDEFLATMNSILKIEVAIGEEFTPITSIHDSFNVHGLDSLGTMMFFVWISDAFGISDTKLQELTDQPNFTIITLKSFVLANCTRTFTYEEAKEYTERCL